MCSANAHYIWYFIQSSFSKLHYSIWYSLKSINKIQNDIYKAEIKIKTTSSVDKNIILKKLLVDICNLANAA